MSVLKLFSVYDSKSETYDKPFPMNNKGECIRGFTQALVTPGTMLHDYPADFTLFEIGEWNQKTGVVEMYPSKLNLGNGLEFKTKTQP